MNAGDANQLMYPRFGIYILGVYDDHFTNGSVHPVLSMFILYAFDIVFQFLGRGAELEDFFGDSNVLLNASDANQLMSPRVGEVISRVYDDHVTNGSFNLSLSMFIWYAFDIVLQFLGRGAELEDFFGDSNVLLNASDANQLMSPRVAEVISGVCDDHVTNASVKLSLSILFGTT